MMLSEHDTPSLLATFSLLTATISNLIRPNRRKSFVEDVKSNIRFFSPFRSGAVTTAMVLELICRRLLNLAEIYVGLGILTLNYSPPDLRRGFWSRFAQRAFLIGLTLPLYVMLLVSASYRWIQVLATLLVAEAVLSELSTFSWGTSCEVRRGWPRRVLLGRAPVSVDHLKHGPIEDEIETSEFAERKDLRDNLCDRVRQLWPPAAEPDNESASDSFPPENSPKLVRIINPTVQAQWTCGHWRCLVYMILSVAVRAICLSWGYIEFASTTWLLHYELHPLTLQVAGKLLESNSRRALLSALYRLGTALLIIIFAYIFLVLLFTRLFTRLFPPLFTYLSKQYYILQRMQRKFQDLAETAPDTHKLLKALGIQSMPVILSYYFARFLGLPILKLTKEILSYIAELIVIPTIYIAIYWLVCSVVRSEQAPPEPELHPKAGQPDSNCDGIQYPVAASSRSTLSNDEFSQTPNRFRLEIFRLAILASTATVWIFLCR